jgi:hypothetical protein
VSVLCRWKAFLVQIDFGFSGFSPKGRKLPYKNVTDYQAHGRRDDERVSGARGGLLSKYGPEVCSACTKGGRRLSARVTGARGLFRLRVEGNPLLYGNCLKVLQFIESKQPSCQEYLHPYQRSVHLRSLSSFNYPIAASVILSFAGKEGLERSLRSTEAA